MMDADVLRCRGCRHKFRPNHRNRTRSKHPQVYCSKVACRDKSSEESKRRYRESNPEDPVKVRIRVNLHRKERKRRSAETLLSDSSASLPTVTVGVPDLGAGRPPDYHRSLAARILDAAIAIQDVSNEVAAVLDQRPCNAITELGWNVDLIGHSAERSAQKSW